MPNRLARESSPYLRQHADNPVDWYPWGDEAFARAKQEDKPIFLSIGYSTCHWCHVMEHESFSHAMIATVLNDHFVSIKVDREERPDIDRVYMAFVQATTGSGGWPMSVWLTTDLEPFYGGTYFPPSSRWGRPGFMEVLTELARLWSSERARVIDTAEEFIARLRETTGAGRGAGQGTADAGGAGGAGHAGAGTERGFGSILLTDADPAAIAPPPPRVSRVPPASVLLEGVAQFKQAFDPRHGGFGDAPKFPRPSELFFLLREHARTGDADLKTIVLETLRAMAVGGMRDHIGGGFHRYAVDAAWRVPHFEKMLYDQAQLVLAYLEGAQASGDGFYAAVADDTLGYVRRQMTHHSGGFFSAEDADSVPPETAGDPFAQKTEGAFYLWSNDEIGARLGRDAGVMRLRYGILPAGNAAHDPQGEFSGRNILYTAMSIADVADRTGRTPEDVVETLGRIRMLLLQARALRPRPHLDDKILTAWNGLMIAAFARAARVLEAQEGAVPAAYLSIARRAASFIHDELWNAQTRTLLRRYREGYAGIEAYSEDYAALVWGLLELFQATGEVEWLSFARTLQERQDELFWDDVEGGWFNTTGEDPSVLLRLKEEYDGAEPAAGSIAAQNALLLSHLSGDAALAAKAERAIARFGPQIGAAARAVPFMLANLSAWHAGRKSLQIVIVGPPDRADTQALRLTLAETYLPFAIVVPVAPGEAQRQLAAALPWIGEMGTIDGHAAAYVCRNFTCERPVTTPGELQALLKNA